MGVRVGLWTFVVVFFDLRLIEDPLTRYVRVDIRGVENGLIDALPDWSGVGSNAFAF